MKILKSTVPTIQGHYFVKEKNSTSWQLLVLVIGVKPFMGIEKIHCLNNERDDLILRDLSNLDWSRKIEMDVNEVVLDEINGFVITLALKKHLVENVRNGHKLQAIKDLKEVAKNNGYEIGLREAKEYCDEL